jgi:hypothetical protein
MLVVVWALVAPLGCGDGDDLSPCVEAREMWCACPSVTCSGEVSSCTGPDREWAECVMDSDEDVCVAGAACR